MAQHPIVKLVADDFGPFSHIDVELSPGLNVITGDNAAGKSFLLKLLYSTTRTLNDHAGALTKTNLAPQLANKLNGVFRPDTLGRLVRRSQGRSRAQVELRYQGISDALKFSFASNSRTEVAVDSFPHTAWDDNPPVFLPSRELLSLYPGLVSLFESREVEFDETWRDTAALLGRSNIRGRRSDNASELVKPLIDSIEGRVVEKNGRFYIQSPGLGELEAHLVAEGFRKLGMIIRLVSNGVLLDGGTLFWDEPETNLNPEVLRVVARAILTLTANGTQVFVATHSVFLLRELELLLDHDFANTSLSPRYIGLYRDENGGVRASSATSAAELESITALDAESEQSLRYLGV